LSDGCAVLARHLIPRADARIAQDVIDKTGARYIGQWAVANLPPEERQEVRTAVEAHYDFLDATKPKLPVLPMK
jgi:hypothetical protein